MFTFALMKVGAAMPIRLVCKACEICLGQNES
jgi:hypothetical protein